MDRDTRRSDQFIGEKPDPVRARAPAIDNTRTVGKNVIASEYSLAFTFAHPQGMANSIARWQQPTATGNPPAATLAARCVVNFSPIPFPNHPATAQ